MNMEPMDYISILVAVLLGAAIGLERELKGKAAGLRTNTLICMGTCVFAIIAKHIGIMHDDSVARVIGNIIGGVGFLGAGVIIQDRGGVHGITTAATIWLVAAVGISCGSRFYLLAVSATFLTIFTLLVFGFLEKKFTKKGITGSKPESDS